MADCTDSGVNSLPWRNTQLPARALLGTARRTCRPGTKGQPSPCPRVTRLRTAQVSFIGGCDSTQLVFALCRWNCSSRDRDRDRDRDRGRGAQDPAPRDRTGVTAALREAELVLTLSIQTNTDALERKLKTIK